MLRALRLAWLRDETPEYEQELKTELGQMNG
jgi:hypothetical protein